MQPSFVVYQGNNHVIFFKCIINHVCPYVMDCYGLYPEFHQAR